MATAFMEILENQTPQDFHGLRDWFLVLLDFLPGVLTFLFVFRPPAIRPWVLGLN